MSDRFGAMMYCFETGVYTTAWDSLTPSDAEASVAARSARGDCNSLGWIRNSCMALAISYEDLTHIAFRTDGSRKEAEKSALSACGSFDERCRVVRVQCTQNSLP